MKVAGFGEIMLRLSTDVGKMILQSDRFNVNYGGGEANVLISLSHFGIDTKMITSVSNPSAFKIESQESASAPARSFRA